MSKAENFQRSKAKGRIGKKIMQCYKERKKERKKENDDEKQELEFAEGFQRINNSLRKIQMEFQISIFKTKLIHTSKLHCT